MPRIASARYIVEWFDADPSELTVMKVESLEYARWLRRKHSKASGRTIWLDDQGRELSEEPGLHEVR